VSATYALLSLAASVYLMVRRDLSHCGQQVFCVDDMSGRLLDFRAGWALFEILFWQNHSAVVQPWKEMVFLHNVVMILQSVAARVSAAAHFVPGYACVCMCVHVCVCALLGALPQAQWVGGCLPATGPADCMHAG
jgi:hypothetical protein